ncbi:MAG: gamma carbonic anhydrase family protein [Myxococcota bacterium]
MPTQPHVPPAEPLGAPGSARRSGLYAIRGSFPRLAPDVWLAPGAVVIGDVEIGAGSSVWFGAVVRGDVHQIRIGARTNLQDGVIVHVTREQFPTRIGDDVTIGHGCVVHGCELGNGAFLGIRATILDGAVVEGGAMVAAGALVTPGKRVPRGELWAGTPARFFRKLEPADYDHFADTSAHYASLAAEYRVAHLDP